jgi:hypothetical protein
MSQKDLPDFSGKLLLFWVRSDDRHPSVMTECRFVDQAGRLFVLGRAPEGVSDLDWMAGAEVAVAWDSVVMYVVFPDVKTYRDRMGAISRPKGLRALFQ